MRKKCWPIQNDGPPSPSRNPDGPGGPSYDSRLKAFDKPLSFRCPTRHGRQASIAQSRNSARGAVFGPEGYGGAMPPALPHIPFNAGFFSPLDGLGSSAFEFGRGDHRAAARSSSAGHGHQPAALRPELRNSLKPEAAAARRSPPTNNSMTVQQSSTGTRSTPHAAPCSCT